VLRQRDHLKPTSKLPGGDKKWGHGELSFLGRYKAKALGKFLGAETTQLGLGGKYW